MSGPSTAADSFAISYTLADGLEVGQVLPHTRTAYTQHRPCHVCVYALQDPLRSERSRTTLCRFFFCCTRRSRQALLNRITQTCAIQ